MNHNLQVAQVALALILMAHPAEGTHVKEDNHDVFTDDVTFSDGSVEAFTGTDAEIEAAADKRQTSIYMEADKAVVEVSPEGMKHLETREGHHDVAEHLTYNDANGKEIVEGFLTVGHGHRVVDGDVNPSTGEAWKAGDVVDPQWSEGQLAIDSLNAYDAAKSQARSVTDRGLAGNQAFIDALTSVNFQLGTNWREKFPTAWKHIHKGNYKAAADEIARGSKKGTMSKWAIQTPERVEDMQKALRALVK